MTGSTNPTNPPTGGGDPRLASPTRGIPDAAEVTTDGAAAFDPLRLCIFATIALLGWLLGPVAVIVFAGIGFAGYWRARRAGLTQSKCYLRDTRLVLAYLALLVVAAVAALVGWAMGRLPWI